LLAGRAFKRLVLLQVPVHSSPVVSRGIAELGIVVGPQEVCHGVTVTGREWKNTVQCRAQLVAREEAQTISNIDDGMARAGGHKSPIVVPFCWAQDLEAPLLREEDGQRSHVGVHVLPHFAGFFAQRRVVDEEHGTLGGRVITVSVV